MSSCEDGSRTNMVVLRPWPTSFRQHTRAGMVSMVKAKTTKEQTLVSDTQGQQQQWSEIFLVASSAIVCNLTREA